MTDLNEMGQKARLAANKLAQLDTDKKNQILKKLALSLEERKTEIVDANKIDLIQATDLKKSFVDRLTLDFERIKSISDGIRSVVELSDPTNTVDSAWTNEAGLQIEKRRVPIGVVGMIYEARPNVTIDAFSLCFKSGNAVMLRGGKEAINTNIKLVEIVRDVLKNFGLEDAIQILKQTSHDVANKFMRLTKYMDVLIPRGSARLISAVVKNATVPVIETGAGNCHIYVDESADLKMAIEIIVNAKVQRPSVCNAAEKLLVNKQVAEKYLPEIAKKLKAKNVELRADKKALSILGEDAILAKESDWDEEYNDYIMAIKVVDSLDEAIKHINEHNTKHSEAIITNNYENSQRFLNEIDAAVVYVNASTRFTDGFEFGFGVEIGISTQKLHARGPMGLLELTSTKYVVRGFGQVRR